MDTNETNLTINDIKNARNIDKDCAMSFFLNTNSYREECKFKINDLRKKFMSPK